MSGIITSTAPTAGFWEYLKNRRWVVAAIVVVLVLAVAAGAYALQSRGSEAAVNPAAGVSASPAASNQDPGAAPVEVSPADSSDPQLDSDLQNINGQLGNLDSGLNDVNGSMNDQQTDLSSSQ